jgi:hypothetical protein
MRRKHTSGEVSESAIAQSLRELLKKYFKEKELLEEKIEKTEAALKAMESNLQQEPFNMSALAEQVPILRKAMQDENEEVNFDSYPKNGSREDKILSIFDCVGKAMRGPDIERYINTIEGPDAKKTLKSFAYIIRSMVQNGELKEGMILNSKKHKFYVPKTFINSDGKLKPRHFPESSSWGKLTDKKKQDQIYTAFK